MVPFPASYVNVYQRLNPQKWNRPWLPWRDVEWSQRWGFHSFGDIETHHSNKNPLKDSAKVAATKNYTFFLRYLCSRFEISLGGTLSTWYAGDLDAGKRSSSCKTLMIVYDCIPSSDLLHDIAIEDGHRNLNCDFSIFFPFNMVIFCSNVC